MSAKITSKDFHALQTLIFELELELPPRSQASEQLGNAREAIGLARRSFEFDRADEEFAQSIREHQYTIGAEVKQTMVYDSDGQPVEIINEVIHNQK